VEDRNAAIDELKMNGFEVIQSTEFVEDGGSAYLRAGDLIVEVAQWPILPE
jgi:hypothetical protein